MRRLIFALVLSAAAVWAGQKPEEILKDAIARHQAGDIEAAIRLYREYLTAGPPSALILSNLGAALAHQGRYAEAIAEYENALRLEPRNPQVLLNLALAYYKTGRTAEARDRLEEVRQVAPGYQVTLLLASCNNRLGDYKKVIALLEPLEKEKPEDPAVNYLLGSALLHDKQTDRGAAVIDRILRKGESAEARLLLGTAKLNASDYAGARADFLKALELNPQVPDGHASLGLALVSLGEAGAAADAFRKELEVDPLNFTAAFQLALLEKKARHFEEASALLKRCLDLRPGDDAIRYQMATGDLATGKLDSARETLEDIVKKNPSFTEGHVSLATVYYRLNRREDGDRERALVRQLTAEAQKKAAAAESR